MNRFLRTIIVLFSFRNEGKSKNWQNKEGANKKFREKRKKPLDKRHLILYNNHRHARVAELVDAHV